ncbi:hypothetical protein GGR53DRAFT_461278 [Hypoxylon sp. FL1150]|nr:hypothetical protein GGR53DRAFT_461278 [Hypoxylon sp. FL1150]
MDPPDSIRPVPQLQGENYWRWRSAIVECSERCNLKSFLDGTATKPRDDDPEETKALYKDKCAAATSLLIQSINSNDAIMSHIHRAGWDEKQTDPSVLWNIINMVIFKSLWVRPSAELLDENHHTRGYDSLHAYKKRFEEKIQHLEHSGITISPNAMVLIGVLGLQMFEHEVVVQATWERPESQKLADILAGAEESRHPDHVPRPLYYEALERWMEEESEEKLEEKSEEEDPSGIEIGVTSWLSLPYRWLQALFRRRG